MKKVTLIILLILPSCQNRPIDHMKLTNTTAIQPPVEQKKYVLMPSDVTDAVLVPLEETYSFTTEVSHITASDGKQYYISPLLSRKLRTFKGYKACIQKNDTVTTLLLEYKPGKHILRNHKKVLRHGPQKKCKNHPIRYHKKRGHTKHYWL